MNHQRAAVFTLATVVALSLGCTTAEELDETGQPQNGTVTARVVSSLGIDDQAVGIDLPTGLQLSIVGEDGEPIIDASVTVYPDGEDPVPLAHQGLGRYEFDVLSGRLDEVFNEYFFEVVSPRLIPERTVLRVPHEPLTDRPWLTSPAERSEHPRGDSLILRWDAVPAADCYYVGTRRHELEGWTASEECLTDELSTIDNAEGFNFVRVRALHELGDVDLTEERYYSRSTADAQVRVYLVDPEE